MAIELLQEYVAEFQDKRKDVTDEVLASFMKPRKMESRGNTLLQEQLAQLALRPAKGEKSAPAPKADNVEKKDEEKAEPPK